MTQTTFLNLQLCPKHLKLLNGIALRFGHQIQAAFVTQNTDFYLEMILGSINISSHISLF